MPAQICLPRSQGLVSAFQVLGHHLPDVKVDTQAKVVHFSKTAFASLDCDHVHWNFCNSVISASEFITDKFRGRVLTRSQSSIKSDLETKVAELAAIRDIKELEFGSKVNDEEIRKFLYSSNSISKLQTLAAYAALFSREKRVFMKGLLRALKDLSPVDLQETILYRYKKLDDLLAYAKSEKFCHSYDEAFDDLFTEYLVIPFFLNSKKLFSFIRKINQDMKDDKYDFRYLLFDYYFQKEALHHLRNDFFFEVDPLLTKEIYEKTKKEGIHTEKVTIIECYGKVFELICKDLLKKSTMKHLMVIKSKIPTIPKNAFEGCNNLQSVFIHECEISTIESGAFQNLRNLEKVAICSCDIGRIKAKAFNNLSILECVDLLRSTFTSVEDKAFGFLPKLDMFSYTRELFEEVRSEIFMNLPLRFSVF